MAVSNPKTICHVCEKPVRYLKHSIQCGCGAKFRNIERIKRGINTASESIS